MVKHHNPDLPDTTPPRQGHTVNPPTPFPSAQSTPGAFARTTDANGIDVVDAPCHLTFDEMRELPLHLALGFDLEGDQ